MYKKMLHHIPHPKMDPRTAPPAESTANLVRQPRGPDEKMPDFGFGTSEEAWVPMGFMRFNS